MDFSTGLFWLGSLALLGAAYWQGPADAADGLQSGAGFFWSVLPRLIAAFAAAGLIQVLIPQEFVLRWIGPESGWRGIAVASLAGSLTPGGPMLSFSIVDRQRTMADTKAEPGGGLW